jgi:membrane protein YqaA with SNARE-associated domain
MPSLQNKKVLLAVLVAVLVVLGGVTYWFFGRRGSLPVPPAPAPAPEAPSTSNQESNQE